MTAKRSGAGRRRSMARTPGAAGAAPAGGVAPLPPRDYESLLRAVSASYEGFSRRLKQIARFALDHPNDMALDTIAVIARRAEVQPSSLIRFAKALGYDGFTDMQRVYRQRLTETKPSYSQRIQALRREGEDLSNPLLVLDRFAAANIAALEHLREEISPPSLEQALGILEKAESIHLLAYRRAFPVASYFFYALNHLDCRAFLLDAVGGMLREQVRWIGDKDALIAVSYPDYSPEVVEVAGDTYRRGIPVIAITDRALSPLVQCSSVCFQIADAAVHDFRSLGSSLCLAQTLVVALGYRLETRGQRRPAPRGP